MAGQDQASEAQRSKPAFGRACSREGTAPYSTREPPFLPLVHTSFLTDPIGLSLLTETDFGQHVAVDN